MLISYTIIVQLYDNNWWMRGAAYLWNGGFEEGFLEKEWDLKVVEIKAQV